MSQDKSVASRLAEFKIIPVVAIDRAEDIIELGKTLADNGLNVIEITFRTEAAADAIRLLKQAQPDMYIGAGTVLTKEQAQTAAECGASFIVAPGLNEHTVAVCDYLEIPFVPGVCTPTEIELALHLGINTVKFFPAEAAGGVKMLKALSGPYQDLKIMPTGGVNKDNINDYLALPNVVACGGTWMVTKALIDNKDWAEIGRLTREAVASIG
ncbi:bifunctional 4-hydroxy-2-oxoglutarate aldolase/2-dehydro-3-deoxy-phosphogluconate aldolase [Vibrio sp. SS-MA-C1-2]|uniref:bifunctional 4-hydroxy-2-oxoglutarate aldolase/2-dehydro-3-deoxy-phosphogluconate aldolase n=1 Tax=Vibrio sp. SS-MA-C1-2 TaxID=2908646 RepID=UPI001F41192D|nr:bifunctional 4-hydroxy-2-oxoglutarate aldolase/2-dehydro-3-deoxy-phosphogluconate aldolase [Vibrio sp. SS-MA-C1-2]UJF17711.1 bifunctional 4-hydroxy-2-oxoglutarate aldolase/2-dehydro-3-deoxy-phosphogluconate aldolase [Vibrio sp. SS-MA-C1-2]